MSEATPIEARRASNRRTLRANRVVLVLFGAIMLALAAVLIVSQWQRTDRELAAPPSGLVSSCCKGDLAFPLGGAFAAWGLATVLTAVVPVRRTDAGTVGLNVPGRTLPAILALPAGVVAAVAVQLADVQPSSVAQAAGVGAGVPLVIGLLAVAGAWWRRSVTATVGSLTIRRAWGSETVALGPGTTAEIVPDHDGSAGLVRLDDGTARCTIRVVRWGDLDRFSGDLHRVLALSGVRAEEQDLARLLLPPSVPAARFVVGPAVAGR